MIESHEVFTPVLTSRFILDASPQITLSDKLGHPFSLISDLPSLFVTTLSLRRPLTSMTSLIFPLFHAVNFSRGRFSFQDAIF